MEFTRYNNKRLDEVFAKNLENLEFMIGKRVSKMDREEYYFDGELDLDCDGTLRITFDHSIYFTFFCDVDAESLKIVKGTFNNKGTLETDFSPPLFKWKQVVFLPKEQSHSLGLVVAYQLKLNQSNKQVGCILKFENNKVLSINTGPSDEIRYKFETYDN